MVTYLGVKKFLQLVHIFVLLRVDSIIWEAHIKVADFEPNMFWGSLRNSKQLCTYFIFDSYLVIIN